MSNKPIDKTLEELGITLEEIKITPDTVERIHETRRRRGLCLACGGDPKIVGELDRWGNCLDCRTEYAKPEYCEYRGSDEADDGETNEQ